MANDKTLFEVIENRKAVLYETEMMKNTGCLNL